MLYISPRSGVGRGVNDSIAAFQAADTLVLMPFGKRTVAGSSIDFDRVYTDLIVPAAMRERRFCYRVDELLSQPDEGWLRHQGLSEIVRAPMVIADVSVAGGDVPYELGVRAVVETVRKQCGLPTVTTVLISAEGADTSQLPFEHVTTSYSPMAASRSILALRSAIRSVTHAPYRPVLTSPFSPGTPLPAFEIG